MCREPFPGVVPQVPAPRPSREDARLTKTPTWPSETEHTVPTRMGGPARSLLPSIECRSSSGFNHGVRTEQAKAQAI